MRYESFVSQAPCNGADPKLFDATTTDEDLSGLEFCRTCTLWSACEEFVNPSESYFDGIAVGAVWKDGRVVAMLRARAERE